MNASPVYVAKLLVLIGVLACVLGFLSCLTIVGVHRRSERRYASTIGASVAWWGAVFFIGSALLLVDCAMGERAPIPVVALSMGDSLGLGSIIGMWLLLCTAMFAASRAHAMHKRAMEEMRRCHDTFRLHAGMRAVLALLACATAATISGCQVLNSDAPAPFADGEDRAYQAIAPAYSSYVTNDLSLDPDAKARRLRTVRAWRMAIDAQLGVPANGSTVANTRVAPGPSTKP